MRKTVSKKLKSIALNMVKARVKPEDPNFGGIYKRTYKNLKKAYAEKRIKFQKV